MNKTQFIYWFVPGEVPTNEEFEAAKEFMNKGPLFYFISLINFDINSKLPENVELRGAVPYELKPKVDLPTPKVLTTDAPEKKAK